MFVMADFGCWLHCIWNQLNPSRWALPWGIFFIRLFEARKPTLSGWHLLVAAQKQGHGPCLPLTLTLSSKSISAVDLASSGFWNRLRTSSSLGILQAFGTRSGLLRHRRDLRTKQLLDAWPLQCETDTVGILRSVLKANPVNLLMLIKIAFLSYHLFLDLT